MLLVYVRLQHCIFVFQTTHSLSQSIPNFLIFIEKYKIIKFDSNGLPRVKSLLPIT